MATENVKIKRLTYWLLFLVLLVFVLIEAREFLYPVFMALLFAYLLYPAVKWLEGLGIPRIAAIFGCIVAGLAVVVATIVLFYNQLSAFLTDFPALQQQTLHNLDRLQYAIDRKLGERSPVNQHWLRQQVINFFSVGGGVIQGTLLAVTSTVTKFGLIPVYIFLMLYYRNKFESFILRLLPSKEHGRIAHIINEISHVTKRYMGGVVVVILILCALNTTGLLLIGVEYAVLLGLLSAFMNFIPYFGTLIGGAIPLLYTLLVQGAPQKALAVLIFFLFVQFTENNILTPNITGSSVNINPFFTILSIIVGGLVWGLPGMFVSVPLLGMAKVYFDNQSSPSPYSYLLGTEGTEEHALTLDKVKRLFSKRSKP